MASLLNMSGGSLLNKGLPYDAEIEYLESSGTQYINTGVIANLQTSVDVKFAFTQVFNDNAIVSMDSGVSNKNAFILEYYYGLGIVMSIDGLAAAIRTNTTPIANTIYTVTVAYNCMKVNGVSYYPVETPYSFTGDYPLFMFAFGRNNSPIIYGKSKIYYCKIYNSSTLVRDYIPVRVGTTGYLYDKISGQLFGNAGTGAFILGPDKTN